MKNAKKILVLIIAIGLVIPVFHSCGKYDDGPSISLRTKTMRLTGEWKVDEIDGDSPDGYDVFFEFEKDGSFTQVLDDGDEKLKVKGDWAWGSGKKTIEIEWDEDGIDDVELELTRLTNKELWFEDEDGDEWTLEKEK